MVLPKKMYCVLIIIKKLSIIFINPHILCHSVQDNTQKIVSNSDRESV